MLNLKYPRLVLIGLTAILAVGGYFLYRAYWRPKDVNIVAVLQKNSTGVGLMEQFIRPQEAVAAFEEVVRMAPDWLPGKVNLAIALFNAQGDDNINRAVQQFNQILSDPKTPQEYRPYAHFCLGIILFD